MGFESVLEMKALPYSSHIQKRDITMKRTEIKAAVKAAVPYSLPILAGYLILGFGFGLLLQSKGYGILWALGMSVAIYAGSMQFVAIDLLASGAGLITTALMTLMANARHLFYGISMLIRYRDMGRAKPFLVFGLSDETYSVVSHVDPPEGVDRKWFYLSITLLDQLYWIAGSALGSAFGMLVPINTTGVDFSMTALFMVIVVDNLMKKESRATSLIGIGCSFVCLMIFGPERFLIPSMLAITAALMIARPALSGPTAGKEDEA